MRDNTRLGVLLSVLKSQDKRYPSMLVPTLVKRLQEIDPAYPVKYLSKFMLYLRLNGYNVSSVKKGKKVVGYAFDFSTPPAVPAVAESVQTDPVDNNAGVAVDSVGEPQYPEFSTEIVMPTESMTIPLSETVV